VAALSRQSKFREARGRQTRRQPLAPAVLVALPLAFGVAGLAAVLLAGRPAASRVVAYGVCALVGLAAAAAALGVLLGDGRLAVGLFRPTPFVTFGLRVDPLAAGFALALGLATAGVSVAALGYARHYDDQGGPRLAALYALFAASMLLVLLADGVFSFLIAWEAMSLVGYLLVTHEHQLDEVRRAGFVYLAMAHLGTGFIVVGLFALVAATPGNPLDFAGLAAGAGGVAGGQLTRDLVFVACLVGFSTKAGAVPLHVWLPRAHPVAPSHVSALMSGVMLKTALYGMARVAFDLLGPASGAPSWWGWLVLAVGLLSAVLGVLYALMEHDLKRLLAYHSVENVGIILIGLGAALVLASYGLPATAGLALAAGLFHTVNHALFKSLLFVGAGAVDQATHTRSLEHLGGLIRPMPQTAALFLVGAMAISALPPLNGFASEWLTFQALLGLAGTGLPAVEVGGLVGAALLALTSGLAAACFVKAFGVTFLGLPRSGHVPTGESPWTVRAGMALLAVACAVLGLFPGAASAALGSAAALAGQRSAPTTDLGDTRGAEMLGAQLVDGLRQTHVQPSLALGVALLVAVGAWVVLRALGPVPVRRGVVWVCGFDLVPAMQYGSTAFAETIRLFFRRVLRPERHLTTAEWALAPYFPARLTTRGGTPALIERHLYTPTMHALLRLANQLRAVQNGSLRYYLLYVFGTLLVLLVLTR